jgi:hypothetical protein
VENEEEKCPFPYYFHNLIFSTQQAVFKTFKRKKNIETQDPNPPRNRQKGTTPHSDDSTTQKGTIILERK